MASVARSTGGKHGAGSRAAANSCWQDASSTLMVGKRMFWRGERGHVKAERGGCPRAWEA
uniref:Uncharacterized protein n=1 Tax=Setaria italica TaxID=4555 RepID=K4AHU4_SETIT